MEPHSLPIDAVLDSNDSSKTSSYIPGVLMLLVPVFAHTCSYKNACSRAPAGIAVVVTETVCPLSEVLSLYKTTHIM